MGVLKLKSTIWKRMEINIKTRPNKNLIIEKQLQSFATKEVFSLYLTNQFIRLHGLKGVLEGMTAIHSISFKFHFFHDELTTNCFSLRPLHKVGKCWTVAKQNLTNYFLSTREFCCKGTTCPLSPA